MDHPSGATGSLCIDYFPGIPRKIELKRTGPIWRDHRRQHALAYP